MKRTLSLILTLVMVIGLFTGVPVTVSAASVDDLTFEWDYNTDSYYVKSCDVSAEGALVIPSEYKGVPVTGIGYDSFEDCENLTSVTIPDTVTYINMQAFSDCSSLKSVNIPDSVTRIGYAAFAGCYELESVYITDLAAWCNIEYEGNYGNPLDYAGKLYLNDALVTDVVIPDGVTRIPEYAFSCDSITSIEIPDSVTSIGNYAFSNAINLKSVVFGKGVKSIDYGAFYSCTGLTAIEIPQGVKIIENILFSDCTNLVSVTIPDGVECIEDDAFLRCENLASINLPKSVVAIGGGAFYYTAYYNNEDNWDENVLYIDDCVVDAKSSLSGEYSIKAGTRVVSDDAFYRCNKLTSVLIPDSVVYIGNNAFTSCNTLVSVEINNSPAKIGDKTFAYCENLSSITIPDTVTSVGYHILEGTSYYNNADNWDGDLLYVGKHLVVAKETISGAYSIKNGTKTIADSAFYYCEKLTAITIPDSVTNMGEFAFNECTNLTTVKIGNGITCLDTYCFDACYNLKSVTIGNSVEHIGYRAFGYCERLTSVVIPDSVVSIDDAAFYQCGRLKTVTIGDGVASIGSEAFYMCDSLTSVYITDLAAWCNIDFEDVYSNPLYWQKDLYLNGELLTELVIPEGVKEIGDFAFTSCMTFDSVTIPDSVTRIGEKAFERESIIDDVYITDIAAWCNIDFKDVFSNPLFRGDNLYVNGKLLKELVVPDGVKKIPFRAFSCRNITSVKLPGSVISIEDEAFAWCGNLTSVKLSEGLKTIGAYAFDYSSLKSIKIPNSVTKIGEYAFSGCGELTSVSIGKGIKTIEDYAFSYCEKIKYVFYGGSKTEWSKVSVGVENTALTNASIHFGSMGHTSSDWITEKKATVNAAGSKYKKCTVCGKTLEKATIKQLKCASPTIKTIANKDYGVRFEWGKVSGADSYKVYRKVSGGSYKYLGKTTKTAYADKTAKSGTKYYYVVKATNEAGDSEKSASKGITFVDAPTIKTPSSAKSGITVKWSKVSGAEGYIVYRKTGSGSYTKLVKVKGGTKVSYLDKTAKKGKTYSYKIEAYKGGTKSAASAVKSIKDKY